MVPARLAWGLFGYVASLLIHASMVWLSLSTESSGAFL